MKRTKAIITLLLPPQRTHAIMVAVCVLLPMAVSAEEWLPHAELNALLSEATRLFRQANEQAKSDEDAAAGLYRKAILRYERVIRDGGIENGGIYYNIGNAYFRMNDLGRAVLNYRRAQQYAPNDPSLQQNLDYARARRLDRVEEPQETRVLKTLFFWHYDISTRVRSLVFAGCFVFLWLGAGIRLLTRRPFLSWMTTILFSLSVLFLASLAVETVQCRKAQPGVVTSGEIVARKGDSETYEPSFREPLHAGTEFELLEVRGEWYHVELINGQCCWVPAKAVELVRAPTRSRIGHGAGPRSMDIEQGGMENV